MQHGAKLHREELHLQELGIATLTSCFVNANRDPKKGEAAKPSDFFYFAPTVDESVSILPDAANAFFALADAGKLPGWCVAIAPIEKLVKSRNNEPCNPIVWTGDGLVLINPRVENGVVRFPLGFVEAHGEIATDGGVVKVPAMGEVWALDGEFAVTS